MKKILPFLKKHKKKLLAGGGILLVCLVITVLIIRRNRDIVAVVNGYAITIDDILVEADLSPEVYKESLQTNPDAVVENYVNQILLFKEAKKYERQLDRRIKSRMKNHYIKELTAAYVETKLAERIKIPAEEVAQYYNAHLEDFVIPERVRLFEIVVSSQRAAEDILRRLSADESFELLATKESLTESKARGGDLGWIDVRKLEPEIAALVTNISPGDILANPIRSEVGYHIIKLAGKTQRRMLTLQEATPVIENILKFQEKKKAVDTLVGKLREKSKIRVYMEKMDRLKKNQNLSQ